MTRTAVAVLLAVLSACAAFAAETSRPPNFVIILADDLGLGDIGSFGATRIATPHTDRMAEEGAILTNFYSGANVCTPSRGALLTGKYPIRLGLTSGVARPSNEMGLSQDETTIATMLREVGYEEGFDESQPRWWRKIVEVLNNPAPPALGESGS